MNKIVGLILLLALVMCFGGALADEKDLYIDQNVQRIFTSEDGLLSTSTQAVAQTREGFIWIGGYGGLVRYDGRDFKTFAYKRITRVSDLAAGEDGTLWVATSDKGIFKYEGDDFIALTGEGGAAPDVQCMAFCPDGRLYLGTNAGLCTVEGDGLRALDIPELRDETVVKLLCPSPERVLCVTRSGKLLAWDGASVRQVAPEGGYAFRSVCLDASDGTYRAGTQGSEVVFLDANLNVTGAVEMDGLSCINDLHCDERGALWLCADNGIAIYTRGSVRMQNLLMDNSVDKMLVDREGNYWFVSSRQGVLEVSRSMFGDVSRSADLDSMVVNAIQRIGDTLYIGHDAGLAAISATDFKKTVVTPLDRLDGVRVRALLADARGSLWIGTMKKGLFRYTPGEGIVDYNSENCPQLLSDNIRAIQAIDGGVLISTDAGAYTVTDGGVANVSNDPDALAFRILCAAKLGDAYLLGSDGTGLYLIRDGEIVRNITVRDGLSSNVIMKAYRSAAFDGMWLVTGNDIDFLSDSGEITSISGFPSTNNLDLLLMENGDAWILTGSGIYQTTEASLLRDEEPKYLQFRRADGQPYEVTPNSYQCMTDGALYVCGSGGVFSLQTDFDQSEAGEYQMIVDSVTADGQTVYTAGDAVCQVGAGAKRIDIKAYVLTYQAGNPFVFYYLEGFDDGETVAQLSKMGDISYTNLNGGSYTFHYGVKDYKTGEILQEITLPIVKLFPWYQKPAVRLGAILAGLLLLALAILLIVRSRSRRITRRLQAEYAQKEKLHLQNIAYRDYLTGLYNRNYLDVWNGQLRRADDYPVTFVSIDLNDLKKVNDSYGHKDGDHLLCGMADLLKKHFAGERYAVLRTGGDEFLILARGVDGGQMRAKLDEMDREAAGISVNDVPLTFAYGLCTQDAEAFDFDDGLRVSDLRMLENKNRFHGRPVNP